MLHKVLLLYTWLLSWPALICLASRADENALADCGNGRSDEPGPPRSLAERPPARAYTHIPLRRPRRMSADFANSV